MRQTLFTDGEGPLVHIDLAQEIAARIEFETPNGTVAGRDFYSGLSFYDDYCAEVGMDGYQAGDTLALLGPHLLHHGIDNDSVLEEASKVGVIKGVDEYIAGLLRDRWNLRIISTAYRPMWNLVGARLNVPLEDIACTELDLESLAQTYRGAEFDAEVEAAEQEILPLLPLLQAAQAEVEHGAPVTEVLADGGPFARGREAFDNLYWQSLPGLGYRTLEAIAVVGGRRKVEAAKRFASRLDIDTSAIAYTGDSITDDKIHEHLLKNAGLPVALNGNNYALRHAYAGVATTDMLNVRPILDAWAAGGREGVASFITATSGEDASASSDVRYHLLNGVSHESRSEALSVHKHYRTAVRGAVTSLLG